MSNWKQSYKDDAYVKIGLAMEGETTETQAKHNAIRAFRAVQEAFRNDIRGENKQCG